MVNSLRAGYSTMQAMEVISNEMPAPISEEFTRVVMELQLGVSFDTAMANLMRRVPSGDMDLVVTAMSVQREVGGNLAEVLDAISFTIRERVRIKGEIKTLTAQGRMTGYVVTGLPFALGGFIYAVNPEFMGVLFTETCGIIMLVISLFLIGLGYFVINKIVDIEV
jgi:tight adherence protein B